MMLSFSPGELSTIEGPISVPAQLKHSMILNENKPFNFGDLPCPPQSVMVDTRLAIGTYFADVDTLGSKLVQAGARRTLPPIDCNAKSTHGEAWGD